MRFFTTLALAASATAAAVGSTTITRNGVEVRVASEPKKCLCKSDVDELIDAYKGMITFWDDAKHTKYLADDFYDWSESINSLIPPVGLPLGFPIFNKTSFIEHQHTQPDHLPLQVDKLGPWNCDSASLVWSATFAVPKPGLVAGKVRGVTILTAAHNAGQWQIKGLDVEFNNIQYLNNIGGSVTRPTPPS